MHDAEQNNRPLLAVKATENGVKLTQWAFRYGHPLPACEERFGLLFYLQTCLNIFDYGFCYRHGLIGKCDHPQNPTGGPNWVPILVEFAELDEQIAWEKRLVEDDAFAMTYLLNGMRGSKAGKRLVSQILQGAGLLTRLALDEVPIACSCL